MTTVFISDWKLAKGCDACKVTPGRAMCPHCLAKARVKWHSYVKVRVKKGLCLHCTRKRQRGQQRCVRCAEVNRFRSRGWYHRVGKERKRKLVENGQCSRCEKPLDRQGWDCVECRTHTRGLSNGTIKPTKKPYKCFTVQVQNG